MDICQASCKRCFGLEQLKKEECEMPLVRISLREGTNPEYQKAIADGAHQAMIDAIAVPAKDRFQVITEYKGGRFDLRRGLLGRQAERPGCVCADHGEYREEAGTEACVI
jgi:Tautomerase enzyme